ncbi:coiled-coil domain-containing protein [Helicobacter pylori]|uniref:coiled-coil domain-containing protein n=1 Tax=Helicobacter pylori TaxID=210 RepID=UPI0036F27B4D
MDLRNLENALNNRDFKEQVYSSLEGIYEISKIVNQLELLEKFADHDLEIVGKVQAIKTALAGYETSEQELKNKINALTNSLEAKKQELEARLNMELQIVRNNETQKLNEAGSGLKNNLIAELTEVKDNLAQALNPQIQGVTKFLGIYIYGRQINFKNQSDEFKELFEFASLHLKADKSYIVQFSMPYELNTGGIYSESMGEMVLCLKADSKVYPIINSFYQNKTTALFFNHKIIDTYRVSCVFKTPELEADYKIGVFARKHNDLWVNVNFTDNTEGFETSFLNNAHFSNLTTQSLPTDYNNTRVFYKHSQALVYEVLE